MQSASGTPAVTGSQRGNLHLSADRVMIIWPSTNLDHLQHAAKPMQTHSWASSSTMRASCRLNTAVMQEPHPKAAPRLELRLAWWLAKSMKRYTRSGCPMSVASEHSSR